MANKKTTTQTKAKAPKPKVVKKTTTQTKAKAPKPKVVKKTTTQTKAKAPKSKVVKKTTTKTKAKAPKPKVVKKTTVKKPKIQKITKKQASLKKPVKKKKTATRQAAKTKKKNSPKKTVAKKKPVVKKTPAKNKAKPVKKTTSNKPKPKKAVSKPLGKRVVVKQIEEQTEIKPDLTASLAVEANKSIDDPFADFSFGDEGTFNDNNNQAIPNDLPVNEPEKLPEAEQIEYIEPVKNSLLSEKQKLIITYTAIASMMFVLVGFWFVGIRNSLSQSFADTGLSEETDMNQTERVQKALDDFNQQLNLIGESMNETEENVVDSLEKNKEQIIKEKVKNNIIDQMKEQLETQPQTESDSVLE